SDRVCPRAPLCGYRPAYGPWLRRRATSNPQACRRRPAPRSRALVLGAGFAGRLAVRVRLARVGRTRRGSGHLRVGLPGLANEALDVRCAVGHGVGDELQGGSELDAGLPPDLRAKQPLDALESRGRSGPFALVAVHRVVDGRFPQVAGDTSLG